MYDFTKTIKIINFYFIVRTRVKHSYNLAKYHKILTSFHGISHNEIGVIIVFEKITFIHTEIQQPLGSQSFSSEKYHKSHYDDENLANSEFYIQGSIDAFRSPVITDFAKHHLYYLQAFDIFHYQKGSFTRRKNFSSFLILYTYSGTGTLEYEGKTYVLSPGNGAFIDCQKPHYYEATEDWVVGVFHFTGPLSSYLYLEFAESGKIVFQETAAKDFQRYLEQILITYNTPDLHRELKAAHQIETLLLHLLSANTENSVSGSNMPDSVRQAVKYLEDHFEESISLDELASLINVNKFYLSKEFKKYTGFSPYDYLIHQRINYAKFLLKTTDLPAVKIAHQVGIHDINNFYYLFDKKVGMTPIQYRRHGEMVL